ncbi:MAG: hypothetical protein KAG06_02955, partial [Methylococcales bacterium]|nr:hypothetical protein [Methylococcales bacterium]
IIAEASLPRFLAAGDQAELTLDLRNQSGETQNLTLNFSSTSPVRLIHNTPLNLVLKDKQKHVLRLPMIAGNTFGQSQIQLQLKNADSAKEAIDLKRQWFLGVRPAYPAKPSVQRRIIHQGESAQVHSQMVGLLASSATAQLNISSQPPIAIKSHLKQLLQYPYGCLEQTISSTYPWLSLTETTAKTWGLEKLQIRQKPIKIQHKKTYIDRGISRLAGMQRSNGGFGLWSNNDREEYWLTAYAVDFLLDAKDQGADVPQEMLEKALKRLTEYINQRSSRYGRGYTQDIKHTNFAYKTYAAYVLSRVNQVSLGTLRTLFKHHHKEAKSALPLTHLGIALFNQGDKVKGEEAILMGLNKPRNDTLYLGDYGSQLRDISLITYLLNKHSILPKRASGLIFSLSDKLGSRDYLSTQERNSLFRMGVLLQSKPQATWQGQLVLGDNEAGQLIKQKGMYRKNFQSHTVPNVINFSSQTNNPLYMSYQLQAYPTESPATKMDLMQIERVYYNLQGQSIDLETIRTGQVVLVHLYITAHQQRFKDALVVDLIPAGFEIENQNLAHNLKIESFKIGNLSIEQLQ